MRLGFFLFLFISQILWANHPKWDELQFEFRSMLRNQELNYEEYTELIALGNSKDACELLEYIHPEKLEVCESNTADFRAQLALQHKLDLDQNTLSATKIKGNYQDSVWASRVEWSVDSNRTARRDLRGQKAAYTFWLGDQLGLDEQSLSLLKPPRNLSPSAPRHLSEAQANSWNGFAWRRNASWGTLYQLSSWNYLYGKSSFENRNFLVQYSYSSASVSIQNTQIAQQHQSFLWLSWKKNSWQGLFSQSLLHRGYLISLDTKQKDSVNQWGLKLSYQQQDFRNPLFYQASVPLRDTVEGLYFGNNSYALVRHQSEHRRGLWHLAQNQNLIYSQGQNFWRGTVKLMYGKNWQPMTQLNWQGEDSLRIESGLKMQMAKHGMELRQKVWDSQQDFFAQGLQMTYRYTRPILNHELQLRLKSYRSTSFNMKYREVIHLPAGAFLSLAWSFDLDSVQRLVNPDLYTELGWRF